MDVCAYVITGVCAGHDCDSLACMPLSFTMSSVKEHRNQRTRYVISPMAHTTSAMVSEDMHALCASFSMVLYMYVVWGLLMMSHDASHEQNSS